MNNEICPLIHIGRAYFIISNKKEGLYENQPISQNHCPVRYEGLWPSAVYIHEFLHSIESYSAALNLDIPVLHDGEKYGYTDKEEWREWYTDYIHKDVVKNGKKVGVDPQVWKLRPSLFN